MMFGDLPPRTLDTDELGDLVARLAARPDLWREHIGYSDDERHFASLYRDAHVDVWLICWTDRNDTGWHDHDVSSGAVHVVEGALVEQNPRIGGDHVTTVVPANAAISFDSQHIHRLTGHAHRSVSIHAYSPPLWRMGQYQISDDGLMRRVSVSYADELRPPEPVPAG